MNKYTLYANAIKDAVSMPQIVDMYCSDRAQKDRIPCPIHNGKDPNLWFSDTGYYCFVCGSGGDEISFIRHLFGLSFADAIRKLAADFNLPISLDRKMTMREQRIMRAAQAERERAYAEKKASEEAFLRRWNDLISAWARCDIAIRTMAPKSQDEVPSAEWLWAIKNKEHIEFALNNI